MGPSYLPGAIFLGHFRYERRWAGKLSVLISIFHMTDDTGAFAIMNEGFNSSRGVSQPGKSSFSSYREGAFSLNADEKFIIEVQIPEDLIGHYLDPSMCNPGVEWYDIPWDVLNQFTPFSCSAA